MSFRTIIDLMLALFIFSVGAAGILFLLIVG